MIKLKSIIKEEILSEQRPNQDTEKLAKILGRKINDITGQPKKSNSFNKEENCLKHMLFGSYSFLIVN